MVEGTISWKHQGCKTKFKVCRREHKEGERDERVGKQGGKRNWRERSKKIYTGKGGEDREGRGNQRREGEGQGRKKMEAERRVQRTRGRNKGTFLTLCQGYDHTARDQIRGVRSGLQGEGQRLRACAHDLHGGR
jgi:hypothetical protein